jgi:putative transposase
MGKPYQISKQVALNQFRRLVAERNPAVQLIFPVAEIVELLKDGLSNLLRTTGRELIQAVMREEVCQLVGAPRSHQPERELWRWGTEKGYCYINGQKMPLLRPRLRNRQKKEVPLGSYEMFQRGSLMGEAVWTRMMLGLSTRRYSEVVKEFTDTYGVEKSTVDTHFIEFSKQKLDQLLHRPLGSERLCAILIDGTCYRDQHLMVAMGLTYEGYKLALGLRQGASENATVVGELLADLQQRGVDFQVPRLYVLDGSKALHSAVHRFAGPAGAIQRCQVHKMRNVTAHLSEQYRPSVKSRLHAAYCSVDYGEARRALDHLHRELMHRNPSAARSLAEGIEETLTVHRLRVGSILRESLASTNMIESAFSIVEDVCRHVKRWRGGDQYLRWVGSALLFAESRYNRVRGYRQIPIVVKELELALLKVAAPAIRAGVA